MKHISLWMITTLTALTLLSGCATSRNATGGSPGATFAGAAIGGNLGSLVGGLIGENRHGWHGGYRGSAIGAIAGTVAGAVIGNAASRNRAEQEAYQTEPEDIYIIERTEHARPEHSYRETAGMYDLHIRNIRFIDDSRDHIIQSDESSKVIFEIINEGDHTVFNVVPVVEELTGMKRIYISPSVMVESIAPRQGIKYTATIRAGKRIKTGEITLRVAVADNLGNQYDGQEFTLPTLR